MKPIDVSSPKYPNAFAMVDDEDFEYLNQWKWSLSANGYVIRVHHVGGTPKRVNMHHLVLPPPPGFQIDHIDRNRRNNQRENLRICTPIQNVYNQSKRKKKNASKYTSEYKGLSWCKRDRRFIASIRIGQQRILLGRFKSEIEAAQAYNAATLKYHGEFAYQNPIPPGVKP